MANAINSLSFNSNTYTFTLPYGSCSTAAATAAKTVTVDNFSLETGARVAVKFTVTNTAASPTLNVNSTGAKAIYYKGAAITKGYLAANKTYEFIYNGTQWDLLGDVDTNTTYSAVTTSANGLMTSALLTKLNGIAEGANKITVEQTVSTSTTNVPSSAAVSNAIAELVEIDTNLATNIDAKLATKVDVVSGKGLSTNDYTTTEKNKLAGIAAGANNYSLPTASSSTLGGVKTTSTVTSTSGLTACPIISGVPYYKDTNTTYSLSSFGVTATATELNYVDGVTSSIQTQLDGKSASGHTHSYAGSSSAGGAATSANKLNTNAGSATQPVYFADGIPKATTYTLGKSVPSNAVFTDTHYASKNVVGATSATSNTSTALSNGAVYLNSVENGVVTSSHKISGSGATTVTTDTSGNIVISSTDNNTTYSAAGSSLGLVKSGGDVTISSGVITVNDDSHNHTIANVDNLQSSLDAKQATITGGASTITSSNLTVSRALVSNSSGKVAVSDVTSTELGYLDGVTSNVQTQLDGKATKSEGAFFIEGSGTTDATAKTSTWTGTSDRITTYYDGLTIRYKIGVAGQSTVTLNINNLGAKTVYRFSTSKLTTHFPVGSIIHLIYHSDLNGGCWVTNDYDANTNTYQRVYESSSNVEYPITTRYNTTDGASYYAEYGRYTNGVTLNPSTNTITASTFKGTLSGNADTATTATTLSGLTATIAELNKMDGVTATTTELNYVDGVTSNIQTQLNGKLSTSGTAAKATADANGNNIASTYATKASIPTSLKSPYAITFTGAATGTYDGSAAKTVNIPTAETVADEVVTLLKTSGDVVVGSVDENKNILLDGALADAMYTLKYKNEDGTTTTIGTLKAGKGYTDYGENVEWVTLNQRWSTSSSAYKDQAGYAVFRIPVSLTDDIDPIIQRIKFSSDIDMLDGSGGEMYWGNTTDGTSFIQARSWAAYKGKSCQYVSQDSNGIWTSDLLYFTDSYADTNYHKDRSYTLLTHIGFCIPVNPGTTITNADLPTINWSINEELIV